MKRPPPTYGRPHPKACFVLDHHYPRFIWKVKGQSQGMLVHHWVWQHFNGPVPRGSYIKFKDGDRWNWRIENLELITPRELGARQIECAARPGRKECTRCHVIKSLTDFRPKRRTTGTSYTAECRECLCQHSRAQRKKPGAQEADKLRQRRRRARDREAYNSYQREYRKK